MEIEKWKEQTKGGADSPKASLADNLHNMAGGSPPEDPGRLRLRIGGPSGRMIAALSGPGSRRSPDPAERPGPHIKNSPSAAARLRRTSGGIHTDSLSDGLHRTEMHLRADGRVLSTESAGNRNAAAVSGRDSAGL